MKYVSTRGNAPEIGFREAVLAGLARDGGLYVPETWPQLDKATIADMASKPYTEIARTVLSPFVDGEIDDVTFEAMIDEAYAAFQHDAVTPLVQTGANTFLLELFHGPTMAFKDVAMQLLSRMMDHILEGRGERVTIVGATSGDTGGAAIEAFRGRDNLDIFIMFPHGKVSDVQRLQMTGVADANVHSLSVDGDFDNCQRILKEMFNNLPFRDRYNLSGVNSINWGRIMPQIVYYFAAATALGAPDRKISFTVPTGNFGDIFAGFVAKQMGLPIDQLIVATNENDILERTIKTGRYEKRTTVPTTSPSMDIQVSSNFERLLFESHGRDAEAVRTMMASLNQSGAFTIESSALERIRADFKAERVAETDVSATISQTLNASSYLLDPHTAIGVKAAKNHKNDSPMVVLGTAHPAKFPDSVEKAVGTRPEMPPRAQGLMEREQRFTMVSNTASEIEKFIAEHSRIDR